jgi:hypothetical protein
VNQKRNFSRLIFGHILGIIDAYGSVHSKFTGEKIEVHGDHFPGQTHCRWRWSDRDSISWLTHEQKPTEEQYDAIQRHLTREYGLKWWENGHHDLDHFRAQCRREELAIDRKQKSARMKT